MGRVPENIYIDALLGIRWDGLDCGFEDWLFIPDINPGKDRLPPGMITQMADVSPGDKIEQLYQTGELVSGWRPDRCLQLRADQFQPAPHTTSSSRFRLGRYYPAEHVCKIAAVEARKNHRCRIIEASNDRYMLDCNHPLSRHPIRMIMQVEAVHQGSHGDADHNRDIAAMVCDQGPGLQDRLPQQETDFFSDQPFRRQDEGDDADYFRAPSLTPFWDRRALAQVSAHYDRLIPAQAHILDLMAGAHSPLEESSLDIARLCCAGLNAAELVHNPICHQRLVLNVNTIEALPFADQQFDVVLIHAAIEYVTQPFLLFREISRVVKPRGRIIISFTNRWLPDKAIRLWSDVDEFERPAIILSYLRSTGTFSNFQSYSKRGLSAADEDRRAGFIHSDPVYLVWADKSS